MAVSKSPSGRTRKSKSEVQAEFEQVRAQVEQQRRDLDAKSTEAEKLHEAEVRDSVAELTVESIVQKIGGLGGDISKFLSDVSSRLMTGTNVLMSLREAVLLERKELERLHKIDIAKTSVDQLVEQYNQLKLSLEKEINDTRVRWSDEQQAFERDKKEFDEALKKNRAREKEEYEYQKALERKKEESEYGEAQRVVERKNKEKQEQLEKSWALREAALKEQEEELAALRKGAAEFPDRLKAETAKQVEEALKAQEVRIQHDLKLLQKESEAEKRLSELKIKSLEDTVARQYAQIESLSERLEEAKKQVQDIAIKAIESASGAKALTHVNQIAMEQAKTRGTPAS